MKGIDGVDQCLIFLTSSEAGTKGHLFKFLSPSCRFSVRKFKFSHTVISEWNCMLLKAVNATTVNDFKNIMGSNFRKRRGLHISQNRSSQVPTSVPHWWDQMS